MGSAPESLLQVHAERSPPGQVERAQKRSISAKNSKKSPGFAGHGSLQISNQAQAID